MKYDNKNSNNNNNNNSNNNDDNNDVIITIVIRTCTKALQKIMAVVSFKACQNIRKKVKSLMLIDDAT